jgi:hypothetical protein
VSNRLDRKIHIEIRPVEVMGLWALDVQHLSYRRLFEPGKFGERQK